ncbi:prephenate dehydratase [Fretibacter rubidus]|uniref:prephenate dehydratase n=1 Tax=Fretibacter rubidus TaxID=570162 RepID=UPI003529DE10
MTQTIVYQGEAGAYSHLACQSYYPNYVAEPCTSFSAAFDAVRSGRAALAMIPVENTVAGRVSDIYHLLPEGGLHIIGEHYLPVHHQLLAVRGAKIGDIKSARSHPMALGQVRKRLQDMGIKAVNDVDTAGAAQAVAALGDKSVAAVASKLAGEIYGLERMAEDIEDAAHNTTRFLILASEPLSIARGSQPVVTSFVFKVRNVPSALYKALGGFATNGLNMTKLESYMVDGSFWATQFYADVEAHPDDPGMVHAMEELAFFSDMLLMLGTYPADDGRLNRDGT